MTLADYELSLSKGNNFDCRNASEINKDVEMGEYYVVVHDTRIIIIPLRVREAQRGSRVKN